MVLSKEYKKSIDKNNRLIYQSIPQNSKKLNREIYDYAMETGKTGVADWAFMYMKIPDNLRELILEGREMYIAQLFADNVSFEQFKNVYDLVDKYRVVLADAYLNVIHSGEYEYIPKNRENFMKKVFFMINNGDMNTKADINYILMYISHMDLPVLERLKIKKEPIDLSKYIGKIKGNREILEYNGSDHHVITFLYKKGWSIAPLNSNMYEYLARINPELALITPVKNVKHFTRRKTAGNPILDTLIRNIKRKYTTKTSEVREFRI